MGTCWISKSLVTAGHMMMLQHFQPTVFMLNTLHIAITSLESKNYSTG